MDHTQGGGKMGLVLRQINSKGLQHEYWTWQTHKEDDDRVDGWGPSDLPPCPICYPLERQIE